MRIGPLLLSGAVGVACRGSPEPETARGDLTFAVMGDAPYYWHEERRYEHLVEALNRESLDWVVQVGDAFWAPCSDVTMRERLEALQRIRHPLVYTPGDNDWADCWGRREGGYDPIERLDALRRTFFAVPGRSLGGAPMKVLSQAADSAWPEFVEHQRWTRGGIVFATVHLVGSANGTIDFPGRSEAHDREVARRTAAATAWLHDTFEEARAGDARAVFLLQHADMVLDDLSDAYRRAFEPFLRALEEEASSFDGPVVMAHGDSHEFMVDAPVFVLRDGRPLANFTRLRVMGSPQVGWVIVAVDTTGPTFSFTPRSVPWWKLW